MEGALLSPLPLLSIRVPGHWYHSSRHEIWIRLEISPTWFIFHVWPRLTFKIAGGVLKTSCKAQHGIKRGFDLLSCLAFDSKKWWGGAFVQLLVPQIYLKSPSTSKAAWDRKERRLMTLLPPQHAPQLNLPPTHTHTFILKVSLAQAWYPSCPGEALNLTHTVCIVKRYPERRGNTILWSCQTLRYYERGKQSKL